MTGLRDEVTAVRFRDMPSLGVSTRDFPAAVSAAAGLFLGGPVEGFSRFIRAVSVFVAEQENTTDDEAGVAQVWAKITHG